MDKELEKIMRENPVMDEPEKRDYTLEDFLELKEDEYGSGGYMRKYNSRRPRDELKVQDQKQTPACVIFGAVHIHNGLNILEDEKYGKTREQTDAMEMWNKYCIDRGYFEGGTSIQAGAMFLKNKGMIEGFVSIPKNTPNEKKAEQMKKAIDMGMFVFGGSARGNRGKIRQTGIYEEQLNFAGHGYGVAVDYVLKEDGKVDYFRAINSRGDKRGKHEGYFKIPVDMLDKLYTPIVFIDKDDKEVFAKLQEVERLKQAIGLLREVYKVADRPVQVYLEKIQMGKNFSRLYDTEI